MPRLLLGLPHLSRGPLLDAAIALGAPVLVSANALVKWRDDGPVPRGSEFNPLERTIRHATGDRRPPSAAQSRRRMKTWAGWNVAALDRIAGLGLEIHLDSAGFVAMALKNGFDFTPEQYVNGLARHPAFRRFSSMDLCVEPEVACDRAEVRERIAKTVNLNRACARLARDAGVADRLMHVIQGATADDYLRCYDAISGLIPKGATVGVGSMCRRATRGPDGIVAIVDELDRRLPEGIRLHLFGAKSTSAEALLQFGRRIDSIDSQAYGVQARREADRRRAVDPRFSKTNVFLAGIMTDWYRRQVARMEAAPGASAQRSMDLRSSAHERPTTVLGALETATRMQFNALISAGDLAHDQMIAGRMLEESVLEWAPELPDGVRLGDAYAGPRQLPDAMREADWFPDALLAA